MNPPGKEAIPEGQDPPGRMAPRRGRWAVPEGKPSREETGGAANPGLTIPLPGCQPAHSPPTRKHSRTRAPALPPGTIHPPRLTGTLVDSLTGSWNLRGGCSTKVNLQGETVLQGMEAASVKGVKMLACPHCPHGCPVWADRDGSCSSLWPGDPGGTRCSAGGRSSGWRLKTNLYSSLLLFQIPLQWQ